MQHIQARLTKKTPHKLSESIVSAETAPISPPETSKIWGEAESEHTDVPSTCSNESIAATQSRAGGKNRTLPESLQLSKHYPLHHWKPQNGEYNYKIKSTTLIINNVMNMHLDSWPCLKASCMCRWLSVCRWLRQKSLP